MNAAALIAKRANAIRRVYRDGLESVVDAPLEPRGRSELAVYAFSSERHLPEQVASLRSLIRHHGVPRRLTVVSDGSHSPAARRLLERVHPGVSVAHHRDVAREDLPPVIRRWVEVSPMGAKLATEWSIPVDGPTLYTDADILFFPGFASLPRAANGSPRFLQDFDERFIDGRLLAGEHERRNPVNAGFQLFFHRLNWDPALVRLEEAVADGLDLRDNWTSEQTVVHLAMHASSAVALPRDRFVLEVDDEHDWRDRYGGDHIAMRHYCYSEAIQRKLWLNVGDDLKAVATSSPAAAVRALFAAAGEWAGDRRRARA